MSHRARALHWFSTLVLISSLFLITAPPHEVQAAPIRTIIVDTALDPFGEPFTPDCDNIPRNRDCSLREAIMLANAVQEPGEVLIEFDIPYDPDGVNGYDEEALTVEVFPGVTAPVTVTTWTITLTASLPALTRGDTTIDGFTQEQNAGGSVNDFGPSVIIAANLSTPSRGLVINSSNNIIRGLGIIGFDRPESIAGIGIEISRTSTGNKIFGCFIGTDKVGQAPATRRNLYGIWIRGDNNTVGGKLSTNGDRNVISGNQTDGILIEGNGNRVQGNYIGLNRLGNRAVPNGAAGIGIRGGDNNIIGNDIASGQPDNENIISGNTTDGITIFNGSNNQIMGNFIGTDTNGTAAVQNNNYGIQIASDTQGATLNRIGAPTRYGGNLISGNGIAGIRIANINTSQNLIQNNSIGPRKNRFQLLSTPYTQTGIIIEDGSDLNQIGGLGTDEGNLISGNYGHGIRINAPTGPDFDVRGTKILNNLIGITPPGTGIPQAVMANRLHGIYVQGNQGRVTDTEIRNNVVSGNGTALPSGSGHGIYFETNASPIRNTSFSGNLVGRLGNQGAPGEAAPNNGDGIRMTSGSISDTSFGTSDPAQRDIVSSNLGFGIYIVGTSVPTLTMLFPQVEENLLTGIVVQGGRNVTINGSPETPALIRKNGLNGIQINSVVNLIALSLDVIENGNNGIEVNTADMLDISANTVNKNARNGIRISEAISPTLTTNTVNENRWNGIAVLDSQDLKLWLNKLNYNGGTGDAGNGVYLANVTTANLGGNDIFNSGLLFQTSQAPLPNPKCTVITDPACNGLMIEGGQDIFFGPSTDVLLPNTISRSVQYGAYVFGPALQVQINGNTIEGNTLAAVKVGDGTPPPPISSQYNELSAPNRAHPQRVTIRQNRMQANGGGILLEPDDTPVSAAAPNHDINPPFQLRMSMNGSRIYGRVLQTDRGSTTPFTIGDPRGCIVASRSQLGCTIDIYKMETVGQGFELLTSVPISDDGQFEGVVSLEEPTALALTATDLEGNTSEFVVYQPFGSLQLVPTSPTLLSGFPDDVLTYTFTITNNGNIDFDSIGLSASADRDWSGFFSFVPSTTFALQSLGMTRTITLTAQIPPGGNLNSLASPPDVKITLKARQDHPKSQRTEVETEVFARVLGRFQLTVTPLPPLTALNFLAQPGTAIQQVHVVTNTGNLTGTVTISATTDRGSEWQGPNAITPTVTILGPGQSTQVTVVISVPTGTLSGTVALTTVRFDTDGPPVQQRIITNTTTATRNTGAIMYRGIPNDRPKAGALEEICRPWVVENTSSGAATFQLLAGTRLNSEVRFLSSSGQALQDNRFSVGTGIDDRDFIFLACVKINAAAQAGQAEELTIYLNDEGSTTRATGQMFIDILQPTLTLTPRAWLPLVRR